MSAPDPSKPACAEKGIWTPVPSTLIPPPMPSADLSLDIERIIPSAQYAGLSETMSFYMTGCSGNDPPTNTAAVATEIVKRDEKDNTAFLYHLGDLAYLDKADTDPAIEMNKQFLDPYTRYTKPIVAIAGNHDGKNQPAPSPAEVFLANFCSDSQNWPAPWSGNTQDSRPAMIQPYPYWRLDTPLACFIGLHANISNGGILDDPATYSDYTQGPQYQWLVNQLVSMKNENNVSGAPKRAVLVTVHYPPYSGTSDFDVRGDPKWGESNPEHAPYLAVALQQAFSVSGQRPHAIFSAHAHLFQRLTYTYADSTVVPCLIVGNGGHSLENLFALCDGGKGPKRSVPFETVAPGSFTFPSGESACVEAYQDKRRGGSYGFIRVTIANQMLTCTYFDTSGQRGDRFRLDIDTKRYV